MLGGDALDELTSAQGSLSLAIAALLLVMGYRFARPRRAGEWVGLAAYALALVAQVLGARGVLPGGAADAGTAPRLAGAVLLVAGLVAAGTSYRSREGRGPADPAAPAAPAPGRRAALVYAGLAAIVLGHLLRHLSVAGLVASMAAAPFLLWAAAAARRAGPTSAPP